MVKIYLCKFDYYFFFDFFLVIGIDIYGMIRKFFLFFVKWVLVYFLLWNMGRVFSLFIRKFFFGL